MSNELIEFTRQALAKGIERSEITKTLLTAGWSQTEITAALNAFANIPFAIPVPQPKPYLSASEVFINLIMFAALYITTLNLGSMIFEFINRIFPDAAYLYQWGYFTANIRWNVSSLIVAFPLFLYSYHLINKAISLDPSRRNSRPRKWLTFLTLFIAALILMCDVIYLIYNFLGGELTIRFVLKAGTIAVLAGSIFIHFFTDVHKEAK